MLVCPPDSACTSTNSGPKKTLAPLTKSLSFASRNDGCAITLGFLWLGKKPCLPRCIAESQGHRESRSALQIPHESPLPAPTAACRVTHWPSGHHASGQAPGARPGARPHADGALEEAGPPTRAVMPRRLSASRPCPRSSPSPTPTAAPTGCRSSPPCRCRRCGRRGRPSPTARRCPGR